MSLLLSGRRDSNSRPIAWKAIALPTELLPLGRLFVFFTWDKYPKKNINQNYGKWCKNQAKS